MPTMRERAEQLASEWYGLDGSSMFDTHEQASNAIESALRQVQEEEREACMQACENVFGKAHTRASENADIYDAQDDAVERCVVAIQTRGTR